MIEKGAQYKAGLLKSPEDADKKTAPEVERLQGLLHWDAYFRSRDSVLGIKRVLGTREIHHQS